MERTVSLTSEDVLSSFLKVGSAGNFNMTRFGSDAEFQDIFKKIPSTTNLAAIAGESPAAGTFASESKLPLQRVASLEFIRTYFTARQNNNAADQDDASNDVNVDNFTKLVPPMGLAAAAAENSCMVGGGTTTAHAPALPIALLNPHGTTTQPLIIPGSIVSTEQAMAAAAAAAAVMNGIPSMQPYIAALNANTNGGLTGFATVPSSVPTSATGGGNSQDLGGYSSGGAAAGGATGRGRRGRKSAANNTRGNNNNNAKNMMMLNGSGDSGTDDPNHILNDDDDDDKCRERRERRMLSNRESARRSRKRKQEHLNEIEERLAESAAKIMKLEEALKKDAELTTLRAQVKNRSADANKNNTVGLVE